MNKGLVKVCHEQIITEKKTGQEHSRRKKLDMNKRLVKHDLNERLVKILDPNERLVKKCDKNDELVIFFDKNRDLIKGRPEWWGVRGGFLQDLTHTDKQTDPFSSVWTTA